MAKTQAQAIREEMADNFAEAAARLSSLESKIVELSQSEPIIGELNTKMSRLMKIVEKIIQLPPDSGWQPPSAELGSGTTARMAADHLSKTGSLDPSAKPFVTEAPAPRSDLEIALPVIERLAFEKGRLTNMVSSLTVELASAASSREARFYESGDRIE